MPTTPSISDEQIDSLLNSLSEPGQLNDFMRMLKKRLVARGRPARRLDARSTSPSRFRVDAERRRENWSQTDVDGDDDERDMELEAVGYEKRLWKRIECVILALSAQGMSQRDVQDYLDRVEGVTVPLKQVSRVVSAVQEETAEWQKRPLEQVYPIVYLDALFVKIRDDDGSRNRAVYLALGVSCAGEKDILGVWVEGSEGAQFWMRVLGDIKNRGVQDILFVCCDGLRGFPEAIEAVFPQAIVQTCVVHLVRNSLMTVAWKDRRDASTDLKLIYTSTNQESALAALESLERKWSKRYPSISKPWRQNWENLVPYLTLPPELRRVIYTTNMIESVNATLRKLMKYRRLFTNDDAVKRLVYMSLWHIERRWSRIRNWGLVSGQLSILFGERHPTA